ncbi:MAG: hypothetical protein ACI8WT_001787 [Clostridium sp.]|jgi:hypothetical protein
MSQLNKDKDKEQLDKKLVALFLLMLSYKNDKEFKKLMIMYKNNREIIKNSISKIYLKYIRDNKLVITNKEITKELKQLDTDMITIGNKLKEQENIILATLLYKCYKDSYIGSIDIVSKYKTIDRNTIGELLDKTINDSINTKIKGKTAYDRNKDNKTIFINKFKKDIKKDLVMGSSIEIINKTIDKVFQSGVSRTDRLVDNEISRIFNISILLGYKDMYIDKVVYNSTLDVNSCEECMSRDGEIVNIEDADDLPAHIRCNCFYSCLI